MRDVTKLDTAQSNRQSLSESPATKSVVELERERDDAVGERDEMRRAMEVLAEPVLADGQVGPPRKDGYYVGYWMDRCLDHATALDHERVKRIRIEADLERLRKAAHEVRSAHDGLSQMGGPGWRSEREARLRIAMRELEGVLDA